MTFQVRNAARVYVNQALGTPVPFAALASSTLVLVMNCRATGAAVPVAPAGWTAVPGASAASLGAGDGVGVFTAPGTTTTAGPGGSGDAAAAWAFYEIEEGHAASIAAALTVQNFFSANTVAGPATTPAPRVGLPVIAIAYLLGTSGDPAPGCYWNTLAGWTKDLCDCQTAGGNHPWWSTQSQLFASAPGSIGGTFVNTVAQQSAGGILIIGKAAATGGFSGEPGGGVW